MILAVFPILINTIAAVCNVSTNLIDVGTAFASRKFEILTKIILPSALPDMMTGLRPGIGRAIIVVTLSLVVRRLERWIAPWRYSEE